MQIASLRFHWLMRPEDAENAYQSYLADDGSRVEGAAKGFWSVQACTQLRLAGLRLTCTRQVVDGAARCGAGLPAQHRGGVGGA